jgi:hypothetical protein
MYTLSPPITESGRIQLPKGTLGVPQEKLCKDSEVSFMRQLSRIVLLEGVRGRAACENQEMVRLQ